MIQRLIGAILLCSSVGYAASSAPIETFSGKTIGSIQVTGLKRIEKEAVLNKLASKSGARLTPEQTKTDIQAVYAMGFFDDVEIHAELQSGQVNLIYKVRERPVISKIEFVGNERITTSDLKDVIKIKEWSILDVNKVKEDVALLQKHYEEKGFYLAKVTFDIKKTKSADQVELIYKVNDYEKVKIKKITFLNNRRFSDRELKSVLGETKEGGGLSWLSGNGNFKESAFKNDLQRLTYFYLDHGYVKFKYENPVVTVSDDKRHLYITIYVDEGEQYNMGSLEFSGDMLFTRDELKEDIVLNEKDIFSISKRNADIQRLTERYQDLGYAFVNVVPKMNIHDDTRLVDIDYSFEKGSLVYFGEINMVGNSKTHDKVIRRELRIHEGELYSGSKMRESKENVERLGFFAPGEVVFNTVTPKGKTDTVNVEISVKERSTGTITLGAGYGSVQKFFFTTQVSEINLLGRGQTVSLTAQIAADRRSKSFNLGFTDPYAFDTRWSMGFDFYFVNFPIPDKYSTRKLGFDIRLGYPIYDYTNAYITYKNEGLKIEDPNPGVLLSDIEADSGVLSSIEWAVVRDKRNNRFETTDGNFQKISLETAGLGGDKKFVKWTANNRFYRKLIGDLVFRNSLEYGQIAEVGGKPTPPSERFYLGGPNNLRGYRLFSVGPSRTRRETILGETFDVREPIGGSVELMGLFEIEYPLIREAGLKWVLFYDVGNTYETWPVANAFTLRSNFGLGFRWFSPIGPLRFEWGFPISKRPGEDDSVFQFFIGPPF